jgi:hypothetical protein
VTRRYRAGDSIEDYCRACKTDRIHTVIAADGNGAPIRVACGYCRSEHNYRGGPRIDPSGEAPRPVHAAPGPAAPRPTPSPAPAAPRADFPLVSERETTGAPTMSTEHGSQDLERLLRLVIREESGLTAVTPAEKWRGGTLVLRPASSALQEKTWPIETFFHKVVMLRNRLRTLEQQINASDMPDDAKLKLQSYITGCYGSLTSFNVLFADERDQFKGTGGD